MTEWGSPRKLAMEFARFLGLPMISPRHNTIDVTSTVCQVLIEARTDLVLVDEIHLLNHATIAGEDLSDHLKYFTEHLPATFVYAGINVEQSGLFTGIRGKQLAGRCILIRTGPFPLNAEWRSLIASMETTPRLHRHEPNTLVKMAKYLHQRTGGMIGSLSHLIRAAAISAILDESEHITKGPGVEPDRKAAWLTAAGFPERVALIHMFTSPRWRKLTMSDDFYVSAHSIAEFLQRFPTESPLRGTSRIWLTKTVKTSSAEFEYRLGNPEGIATLLAN